MAEIVLFHHAGTDDGVDAFAAELRRAGHTVHVPDLYEGHIFDTLDDGLAYATKTGFDTFMERGVAAAEGLSDALVYAGFSLGVMPAQRLAQTRPEPKGRCSSTPACRCRSSARPGQPTCPSRCTGWTATRSSPMKATSMPHAPWSLPPPEPSCSCIRARSTCSPTPRLPSYDEAATALLTRRVVEFLDRA